MGCNAKQILFKFDFIGPFPEFRILDDTRYKSIFSSILSILLIIFAIVFVIYSFEDYLNQSPKVEYYKNNDFTTNKTFVISDSLLMFGYSYFCSDNFEIEPTVEVHLDLGIDLQYFTLEPCELGKNLNIKYKEVLEKFDSFEIWKYNEYYCINYNGTNATLYSHPSLNNINEPSLVFKISAECEDYLMNFKLVTENDFIDHNDKDNPIVPYYQINDFGLNKRVDIIYNYQYIKYESDNGFIFNDKKTFNGIGISASNSYDTKDLSEHILYISFRMNGANYDFYRRSFTKFQTFLAESMSLISLLITISKVVTEILLYKKMHKDIIKHIITNKEKESTPNKLKLKKIFDINDNKVEKSEKRIEQNQIIEEKANSKISLKILNKDCVLEIENENKNMIKVMKNLNFINIIKSFFCCKDKKLKLINLCNEIVNKDICVERILRRLYILENEYNSIIKGDTSRTINDNSGISKVKKLIKKINKEINKNEHLSKENNMINK